MYDPRVFSEVVSIIGNSCTRTGTVDIPSLIEKKCGRYVRGKHQGKLRGWATWTFVIQGGWLKDGPGYMNGYVVRPGQYLDIQITDYNGKVFMEVRP